MSTLSSWMPFIIAFSVLFVCASLVSALVYWVAHLSSPKLRWGKIGFSVLATCGISLFLVGALFSAPPWPILGGSVVVVGLSALQAQIERSLAGHRLVFTHYLKLTFFSNICSLFIVNLLLAVVSSVIARASLTSPLWVVASYFYVAFYGLCAGLVMAPLSISFFRRMFQTLALRPGIDRPLRADEIVT